MKSSHLGWLDAPALLVDRLAARLVKRGARGAQVVRPILILGPERSGTTLLYSLLSNHPDLYWLSRLDSVIPDAPVLATWLRRLSKRFLWGRTEYYAIRGTISRSRGLLPPSECLPYWKRIFRWGDESDYGRKDDRFTDSDLTESDRREIHKDLRKRLEVSGKTRLLFKQPGFSLKIPYLDALFPDAIFIHCVRHPLDNLLSLVKAKLSSGERFWGTKIPGWRDHLDTEPTLQAALQIEAVERTIEDDIAKLEDRSSRYRRVRVEDLQSDGRATLASLLEFCGLGPSPAVESAVRHVAPRDAVRDYSLIDTSDTALEIVTRLCTRSGYDPP